jgi:hypothetical protein
MWRTKHSILICAYYNHIRYELLQVKDNATKWPRLIQNILLFYNLLAWYHNPIHTLTSSASLHIWFLSSVFLFYAWIPRIFGLHWIISRTLYSGALFFHYPVFHEFFRSHLIISKDLVSRLSVLTLSILSLCLGAFHLFWSISQSPKNSNFHHFYYI